MPIRGPQGNDLLIPARAAPGGGSARSHPRPVGSLEGLRQLRIGHLVRPAEGRKFLSPSFCHEPSEFLVLVVRKVEKWRGGAPLFTLEEQGHEGRENGHCRDGLQLYWREQHAQALALGAIADLVMILRAHHQLIGPYTVRAAAMAALAMDGILALIHVAIAKRPRQIFDTVEIHVVADGLARHLTVQRVVEIVGPVRIQAEAAAFGGIHEPGIIQVAFGDEHDLAVAGCREGVHGAGQFLQQVHGLETVDRAHGIQSQPIETVDVQPHARVVENKLPDAITVCAVVVDRIAPGRFDQVGEIRREVIQVVAIRAEMVVDHIQQHGEAVCMAGCDKPGEILRSAVGGLRRKQIDTVIAPPMLARKGRKRHDFDMGHAKGDEMRELLRGARVGSLGRESADVQLIDNGLGQRLLLEGASG